MFRTRRAIALLTNVNSRLGDFGRYPTNVNQLVAQVNNCRSYGIFNADIYRDGGSRCYCVHADDENWFEFHVPVKRFDGVVSGHTEPKIYLNSVNDRNVVREFSWDEAREFVAQLHFDKDRFRELVDVVSNRGIRDFV